MNDPTTVEEILARRAALRAQSAAPPEVETSPTTDYASDPATHGPSCWTEWADEFSCVHGVIGDKDTLKRYQETGEAPKPAPVVDLDALVLHKAHLDAGQDTNAHCLVCQQLPPVDEEEDDDFADEHGDAAALIQPSPEAEALRQRLLAQQHRATDLLDANVVVPAPEGRTGYAAEPVKTGQTVTLSPDGHLAAAGQLVNVATGRLTLTAWDLHHRHGEGDYTSWGCLVCVFGEGSAVAGDDPGRLVEPATTMKATGGPAGEPHDWSQPVVTVKVDPEQLPAAVRAAMLHQGRHEVVEHQDPEQVAAELTGATVDRHPGHVAHEMADWHMGAHVRLRQQAGADVPEHRRPVGRIVNREAEVNGSNGPLQAGAVTMVRRCLVNWGRDDNGPVETWHDVAELEQVDYEPAHDVR